MPEDFRDNVTSTVHCNRLGEKVVDFIMGPLSRILDESTNIPVYRKTDITCAVLGRANELTHILRGVTDIRISDDGLSLLSCVKGDPLANSIDWDC